jgi:hypothetical protein
LFAVSRLLLPSKLPMDKPGFQLNTQHLSHHARGRVGRLFAMTHVPSGLWSRLLVRIIGATSTEIVVQHTDDTMRLHLTRDFVLENKCHKLTADR